MPLTLEQYIEQIHQKPGIPWPKPMPPEPVKAKPSTRPLGIRAVLWNVYGTLLNINGGEIALWTEDAFLLSVALEKTIHEFKMWGSMSRKPGQPSEYMKEIYKKEYDYLRLQSYSEKIPELACEKIWDAIIKKLQVKEYKYDVAHYGSQIEYAKKIAYFFQASLQGVEGYPRLAETLEAVANQGIVQGLLGDGQCFTYGQLQRCVKLENPHAVLPTWVPVNLGCLSYEIQGKKPSDTLFRRAIESMKKKGIDPDEILHVGSHLVRDIAPAKKWGLKTALFAGDKKTLVAPPELLKEPNHRPDALITELNQVLDLIG